MKLKKSVVIIAGTLLLLLGIGGTGLYFLKNSNNGITVSSVTSATTSVNNSSTEKTTNASSISDTVAETTNDSDAKSDSNSTTETDETSDTESTTKADSTTVSSSNSKSSKKAPELKLGNKKYKLRKNMDIVLVMGIDDRGTIANDGSTIHASQADCIYVYAIDHSKKTVQILQINRDSMASVREIFGHGFEDEFSNMQICLAHSYGKTEKARCLNTVEAVKRMMSNTPIDHYISFKMDGIAEFNDQVGGVTIKMPTGLESIDPAFKAGETVTLKGKQAENYLRARFTLDDDHNAERMKRQEIYMSVWKKQAISKMNKDSGFAAKFILAVSEYMYSDMSANKLSGLANNLKGYNDLGTLTPSGKTLEAGNGRRFREFYVNKDDLKKKVIELFYEAA